MRANRIAGQDTCRVPAACPHCGSAKVTKASDLQARCAECGRAIPLASKGTAYRKAAMTWH